MFDGLQPVVTYSELPSVICTELAYFNNLPSLNLTISTLLAFYVVL